MKPKRLFRVTSDSSRCAQADTATFTAPADRNTSKGTDPIGIGYDVGAAQRALAIEKAIGLEDKLFVVLVVDAVIRVRENNHLCVWDILSKVQRINRVHDDLVVAAHDECGLLDLLQVRKALPNWLAPLHYSRDLSRSHFFAVFLVAVLGA